MTEPPQILNLYSNLSRDPHVTIEKELLTPFSVYKIAVVAKFEAGRSEEQIESYTTGETGMFIPYLGMVVGAYTCIFLLIEQNILVVRMLP